MSKSKLTRIKKIMATGIASIALVAPLVLSNLSTVNASHTSHHTRTARTANAPKRITIGQAESQLSKERTVVKRLTREAHVMKRASHSRKFNAKQKKVIHQRINMINRYIHALNKSNHAESADIRQTKNNIRKYAEQHHMSIKSTQNEARGTSRSNHARTHKHAVRSHKHVHTHMHHVSHMHIAKNMNSRNMLYMRIHGTSAPKGLKEDHHAEFHKGEHIIVKANHMPGMKGAHGTIAGAYNTPLYAVDYYPTNHTPVVKNHKWVVRREIKSPTRHVHVGEHVTLTANHMKYMYGSKAKIVGSHRGPAYMINYHPINNPSMTMTNHKWVAQSELKR